MIELSNFNDPASILYHRGKALFHEHAKVGPEDESLEATRTLCKQADVDYYPSSSRATALIQLTGKGSAFELALYIYTHAWNLGLFPTLINTYSSENPEVRHSFVLLGGGLTIRNLSRQTVTQFFHNEDLKITAILDLYTRTICRYTNYKNSPLEKRLTELKIDQILEIQHMPFFNPRLVFYSTQQVLNQVQLQREKV